MGPVFLRLSLGLVFIWAGLSKVMGDADHPMKISGEDAAILANMGVPMSGGAAGPSAPKGDAPKPTSSVPGGTGKPTASHGAPQGTSTAAPDPTGPGLPELMRLAEVTPKNYAATDFPGEVEVKPVYMLALTLKKYATPDGKGTMMLWPSSLGKGSMPVWTAWAVTWAEIGGGALVLVGLLTRLGSVLLAGVMMGAIWLTQVGPAIQSGKTQLGFLPIHGTFDAMAWQMLMVQFILLCSALALLCTGSGGMGLDRALFGGKGNAKPAAPKPAA